MRYLVLILILACFPVRANATTVDPCSHLVEADTSENWYAHILALFARDEPAPDSRIGDAEFWFTKQPGRFASVACGGGTVEMQEAYPIGVIVRPLGIVDDRYLGLWRRKNGTPVLVLTEYGHRKILPLDAIHQISPNVTYLFADEFSNTAICRSGDGCLSHDPGRCTASFCPQVISPIYGYATAASADPTFAAARAAYDMVMPSDPLQPPPPASGDTVAAAWADLCVPFPVRAFTVGGRPAYPDSPDPSHLTLCEEALGPDVTQPAAGFVKMVDLDYAEARFGLLSGAFQRRAVTLIPGITSRIEKPCGTEQTDSASGKFTFSTGIDLRKIVQITTGAQMELAKTTTIVTPKDEYFLIMSYFMDTPAWLRQDDASPIKLFRIHMRADCDGSDITRAKSITVEYQLPSGEQDNFEIGATTSEGGIEARYIFDNGTRGFNRSGESNRIQSGYFWHIADHEAYYYWRDLIRSYLTGPDVPLLYDELRLLEPQEQVLMRDFYTHLMLSSAFHYVDFCDLRNVICQRP